MHKKSCLLKNPEFKKLSRPAQKRVSKKISVLRREGYSAPQAAAIAYNMERKHEIGSRGRHKRNPVDEKQKIVDQIKNLLKNNKSWTKLDAIAFLHNRTQRYTKDWDVLDAMYKREHSLKKDKKNPIEDKDVVDCVKALVFLARFPHMTETISEHVLDAIESEGLWSYEKGVTGKGTKFLMAFEEDDESVP